MTERYLSIQYLRALAALMVVFHHSLNRHPWLFHPDALGNFTGFARGVDVFFVISGFIIATVGVHDSAGQFLIKRCIRVMPMYWVATVLGTMIEVLRHGADIALLIQSLQSLAFIPHLDRLGQAFPIVPPGWTLNLEMFFYGIFALCLLTARPVALAGATLLGLVLLGTLSASTDVIFTTYTSPQMLEFVAGLALGAIRKHLVQWRGLGLLMLPSAALLLTSEHWLQSLVAATGMVACGLSLERRLPLWPSMKRLGDASFFLYLSHHFVLMVLITVWKKLPLDGPLQFITLFASCVGASVWVGLQGHRLVEKPLTQWLQHCWARHHVPLVTSA